MLHTVSGSIWSIEVDIILPFLSKGDDLLLLSNAVSGALRNANLDARLTKTPARLLVLNEDLEARGLSPYISPYFTKVNYSIFVDLIVKHKNHIAW